MKPLSLARVPLALVLALSLASCGVFGGGTDPAPAGGAAAGGGGAAGAGAGDPSGVLPRSEKEVGEVKLTLFSISHSQSYGYVGVYFVLISEGWKAKRRPISEPFSAFYPPNFKTADNRAIYALLTVLQQKGFFEFPMCDVAPVSRFKSATAVGCIISVTIGNRTWMVDREKVATKRLPDFILMKEAIAGAFAAVTPLEDKIFKEDWRNAFQGYLKQKKGADPQGGSAGPTAPPSQPKPDQR